MSADSARSTGPSSRALFGLVAEFDDVDAVLRASRAVHAAGHERFDVFSPFPIHGIERAMGVRPTRLPWIVLLAGTTGLGLALFFQWWTNAIDYPFQISGKPLFGVPANIPVTFEFTVLLSAFAAFFGMLVLNRLPQHHHALFDVARFKRATDDGFFLAVEAGDARFDVVRTRQLLQSLTHHPVIESYESNEGQALPKWVKTTLLAAASIGVLPLALIGLRRGDETLLPAIHVVPDMDFQPRYRAQAPNPFFADRRSMRPNVVGAVARGELEADLLVATGKNGEAFVERFPVAVDEALLARGRDRYAVFCTPCHGVAGYGDGLVGLRAKDLQEANWVPPASLHDPLVRTRAVGQIFDTIRNGVRTMPAYGRQMSVADSWAIVAYVRALQRSQNATPVDVPAERRGELGPR